MKPVKDFYKDNAAKVNELITLANNMMTQMEKEHPNIVAYLCQCKMSIAHMMHCLLTGMSNSSFIMMKRVREDWKNG